MTSKLIVGLGNPGPRYALTRHNIGFLCLDYFSQGFPDFRWSEKFKGHFGQLHDVMLLKPMTFMNKSGESVREVVQFYKIPMDSVLVVHDEVDLPFGQMKFQTNRSAAGHNGIKSLVEQLGTQEFHRLRLGVGRPLHPQIAVADHVLERFTDPEQQQIPEFLNRAGDGLEMYLAKGLTAVANEFNSR